MYDTYKSLYIIMQYCKIMWYPIYIIGEMALPEHYS